LTEYVQVDKEMLKEILREISELKKLATELVGSCSEFAKELK
jgi:uncharacterized protein YutE (UPF0331/DUF86 family)